MNPDRRRFGRTRAAAALLGAVTMVPRWWVGGARSPHKRAQERRFLARCARAFVADIRRSGAEPGGPGTLYVANHISWLDIPVIAAVIDAEFVAKDDVQGWPLVGALALRTATVFVARDKPREARAQAEAIADRLRAGGSLILFAEGTTSDGTGVLPFLSSLFAAAPAAARLQPMAIGYRRADGAALDDAAIAQIGWTGDEALVPNAARLAGLAIAAEVMLLDPLVPGENESRRDLTARCHRAVADGYAALRATKRSA